uniref:(northern house mosquito) hypothetical protein n=1 Tax=Culex pipiens TaxID=7175 RepID=A0A8D8BXT1_CULPI
MYDFVSMKMRERNADNFFSATTSTHYFRLQLSRLLSNTNFPSLGPAVDQLGVDDVLPKVHRLVQLVDGKVPVQVERVHVDFVVGFKVRIGDAHDARGFAVHVHVDLDFHVVLLADGTVLGDVLLHVVRRLGALDFDHVRLADSIWDVEDDRVVGVEGDFAVFVLGFGVLFEPLPDGKLFALHVRIDLLVAAEDGFVQYGLGYVKVDTVGHFGAGDSRVPQLQIPRVELGRKLGLVREQPR